jgi:hypothetical protein
VSKGFKRILVSTAMMEPRISACWKVTQASLVVLSFGAGMFGGGANIESAC